MHFKLSKKTYLMVALIAAGVLVLGISVYFLLRASADSASPGSPKSFAVTNDPTKYSLTNVTVGGTPSQIQLDNSSSSAKSVKSVAMKGVDMSGNNASNLTKWYAADSTVPGGKKYFTTQNFSNLSSEIIKRVAKDDSYSAAGTIKVDFNSAKTAEPMAPTPILFSVLPADLSAQGITVTSVIVSMKQDGKKTYVSLADSLNGAYSQVVKKAVYCTGDPCIADMGNLANADLNNLYLGVWPATPVTGKSYYTLDKIAVTINYSTSNQGVSKGTVRPIGSNYLDSSSTNNQWLKMTIGSAQVPAGTSAQIQWFSSDNPSTVSQNYELTPQGGCKGSCSPIMTLTNNTGATVLDLANNSVYPTGRYGKFVLYLWGNSAAETPKISNVISLLYGAISNTAACPVITNFTPSTAPIGGDITVIGSNFGATQGKVYLVNSTGTSAEVTVPIWTNTQIAAHLYQISTSQPVPAGVYKVSVRANGCSTDAVASSNLTITSAASQSSCPTIDNFSPTSTTGFTPTPSNPYGGYLLVNGSHFGTTPGQLLLANDSGFTKSIYNAVDANNFWKDSQIQINTMPYVPDGNYYVYVQSNAAGCSSAEAPGTFVVTTPISVDLKVNNLDGPTTVVQGSTPTLTWTSIGASKCSASREWTGDKLVNGSEVTLPIMADTVTFSISCSGPAGQAGDSVIVQTQAAACNTAPKIIAVTPTYFNHLSAPRNYTGTTVTIDGINLGAPGTIEMRGVGKAAKEIYKLSGDWTNDQIKFKIPNVSDMSNLTTDSISNVEKNMPGITNIIMNAAKAQNIIGGNVNNSSVTIKPQVKQYYFVVTPAGCPSGDSKRIKSQYVFSYDIYLKQFLNLIAKKVGSVVSPIPLSEGIDV